jgi:hypothetical protein
MGRIVGRAVSLRRGNGHCDQAFVSVVLPLSSWRPIPLA